MTYRTIINQPEGFYKEKGSKFLAFVQPVASEKEVKVVLENYRSKFYDARHHCFAFRIGINNILERSNDDGEPSGTAGKPILGQLHSFELTNVIVVVIRYFGGTKLGTGGLINAYKTATREALLRATIIEKELKNIFHVSCKYEEMGEIISFLKQQKIDYSGINMQEMVSIKISLGLSQTSSIIKIIETNFKTTKIVPVLINNHGKK